MEALSRRYLMKKLAVILLGLSNFFFVQGLVG